MSNLRDDKPRFSSGPRPAPLQILPLPQCATSAPTSPPLPPPRGSRWRGFLAGVGRITLITLVGGAGTFYYLTYKDRHPGVQLPYDPSKKNIVVLGSGWAATSFLKNIDNTEYNVIVVSPRNFFLFTPLLPSVAVGTLTSGAILQPTRYLTRHKPRQVTVIEAEVKAVDPQAKTVTFADESEVKGAVSSTTINYDYLVYAVGAETQTFGIPGVQEHACFMKEINDAENMKRRFMDCIETAAFPGQSKEEIDRLLHMVVVGGGPTGVEVSGEIHDFLVEDLKQWYPELADRIRITLVEALPSVLPMFSKKLIDYTISTFKEAKIDVLTNTMVKEIKPQSVVLQMPDKTMADVPVGMVVWAGGNKPRQLSVDLMNQYPELQKNRRGITIDDCLRMVGPSDSSVFALGDCTSSGYAPTAQVASQQGAYLAGIFHQLLKRDAIAAQLSETMAAGNTREAKQLRWRLERANNLRPFHYSHQGSLAYIGHDRAIADVNIFNKAISSGGVATFLFWRSAYLSTLFSLRNRFLVANDWIKCRLFGRDLVRD
ncbi:NADH dehydrogenase [Vararia minispora EC-137]|uniref:NADH dehydrogenase n=1 Tax=Vararia minispora EC-137 TaxID=1314806 RepID=A0ACB8Q7X8_9AGAM|nr:NADH dehydrogenase [Vararia minispora EC-137]